MIPTGNVILSFDYNSISKFLEEGASYQSLIKEISDGNEDLLLFNNESNPNFISFEHILSVNGEPGFKITFIDPKQEFEKRFLSGGLLNSIAGTAYTGEVNSLSDYFGKKRSSDVAKSLSKFDRSFYEELSQKLVEANNLKVIYVVYGVGNNLKLWSGPHKTYFTNVDISPASGGARKITLVLNSSMNPLFKRNGAFNEVVDLNLAGMTMRCNGTSQEVLLKKYPDNVYDVVNNYKKFKKITDKVEEYRSEEQTTLREAGFEKFVDLIKNIDIHSMIVDAIRNYVQAATRNKNVIVLIPNINVACREYLTHLSELARLDSQASIVADSAGGTAIGSMQASLNNSLFPKKDIETLSKIESFLALCLTDFGMQLQKTELGQETRAFPQSSINILKSTEKKPNPFDRYKDYVDTTHFRAIITQASDKGLPKHTEKLITIFDRIKEASKGNYSLDLVILTETQLKVLDFWSKGLEGITPSDYPTFGGYDKFNEKTEAIIVGDKGLISEYLYGQVSIEDKEKQIEQLRAESLRLKDEAEAIDPFAQTRAEEINPWQTLQFEQQGPPSPFPTQQEIDQALKNFTVSGSVDDLWFEYTEAQFVGDVDFSHLGDKEFEVAIDWALMNRRLAEIGAPPSYEAPPWYQYGPFAPPAKPITVPNFLTTRQFSTFNSRAADTQDRLRKESRDLKAFTLNVVPLHPVDKIILLDKNYLRTIKSILYIPITGAGSFGDISYLPDEFAYSDVKFSEEEKNKIRQKGIPVFRYNIQNPNILDINIKASEAYLGMLQSGFSKVISRKASARVEALLPEGIGSFPIKSKEEAILFLRKKQFSTGLANDERNNLIKDMIAKFDPEFVKTFADTDPQKAAKVIVALLDTLEKVDHKQFIEIGQHMPSDPVSVMSEIVYDLYQNSSDVTIKTLPTFHISTNASIINNPCIVLAQDVPILQENKLENSVLNSFIGGFYFIVGFKHTIDATSGMYSEFNLIKPVAGIGNIDE